MRLPAWATFSSCVKTANHGTSIVLKSRRNAVAPSLRSRRAMTVCVERVGEYPATRHALSPRSALTVFANRRPLRGSTTRYGVLAASTALGGLDDGSLTRTDGLSWTLSAGSTDSAAGKACGAAVILVKQPAVPEDISFQNKNRLTRATIVKTSCGIVRL